MCLDLTLIVTRANTQEFELLQDYVSENRPDVKLMYMSSRATSMAQPLLAGYREKLCAAGYGPLQVKTKDTLFSPLLLISHPFPLKEVKK